MIHDIYDEKQFSFIDKTMFYESPFTDLNDQGISGVFDNDADLIKIVKIIDLINDNAEVA